MFKLKTSGNTCTVTRTLDLPKTGPLPKLRISSKSSVKIKLAGLKPNAPVVADVVSTFENVYLYELDRFGKAQDLGFVQEWKTIASELEGTPDPARIRKRAAAFEARVLSEWNEFTTRTSRRYAESSLRSAVESVGRKTRAKLEKPTIAFGSEELKSSRLNILTSILGALTLSVAAGPAGWFAAALGGIGHLTKGYVGAWDIARKRASDIRENLVQIDEALARVAKETTSLSPRIEKLASGIEAMQADLLSAALKATDLQRQLAELEKRARKEKAVREGDALAAARGTTEEQQKTVAELRKKISSMQRLKSTLADVQKTVAAADALSTEERKGWDGMMTRFSKASGDVTAAMNAIVSGLKKV